MEARARVAMLAAALWWGSLSATGFLAVPLLFAHLPTPALAGQTAAHLFTGQAWVGIACGVLLLAASRGRGERARIDATLGFILAGVLLALLGEFAVAPRIVARENLRLWHAVGSAMYLLQWGCALVVLWRTTSQAVSPGGPS